MLKQLKKVIRKDNAKEGNLVWENKYWSLL
jgi:hypothetical protein